MPNRETHHAALDNFRLQFMRGAGNEGKNSSPLNKKLVWGFIRYLRLQHAMPCECASISVPWQRPAVIYSRFQVQAISCR